MGAGYDPNVLQSLKEVWGLTNRKENKETSWAAGGVVAVGKFLILGSHRKITASRTFRADVPRGIGTAVAPAAATASASTAVE